MIAADSITSNPVSKGVRLSASTLPAGGSDQDISSASSSISSARCDPNYAKDSTHMVAAASTMSSPVGKGVRLSASPLPAGGRTKTLQARPRLSRQLVATLMV